MHATRPTRGVRHGESLPPYRVTFNDGRRLEALELKHSGDNLVAAGLDAGNGALWSARDIIRIEQTASASRERGSGSRVALIIGGIVVAGLVVFYLYVRAMQGS